MQNRPPLAEGKPSNGDPVWVEGSPCILIERVVADREFGRFAVELQDKPYHRHIIEWRIETGWTSIMSWCVG